MKIQTMLTRGITVLVILALCISPVSAINILNEQDFEVLPDNVGMDTETAITTFLAREMKLSDAAVKSRKVRKSSMTCHILLPVLGQNMGQSQIVLESLRQRKNSPW